MGCVTSTFVATDRRAAGRPIGAPVMVLGKARDGWVPVKLSDGRSGYVWENAIQYDPPR
jgi:hypothetical protein